MDVWAHASWRLCNDGGIGVKAQYIVCKLLFVNDKHGVMVHKKSLG